MKTPFALLALVACSSSAAPPPQAPAPAARVSTPAVTAEPAPKLRLPRTFLPTGYAARLAIDPAANGFDGAITITGALAARSPVIWLHAHGLTVARATAAQGGHEVALAATPRDGEYLELRAPAPLDRGTWTLTLAYKGSFDTVNTNGAFKQVVDNTPYVYSQFEAIYARRVFPCFDEPDSKVPWQLTIDVPAGQTAVSNTPVAREEPLAGGGKRVVFGATKPLPAYLVAFGVGAFDIVDAGHTRRGVPVRVITGKDRARDAALAAKTAPRLLDLLEEVFGSPYPYEKLDVLSVPLTVGFGAMENAGLVTFTETLVLHPPEGAARSAEYDWIYIAAHEFAHQWFGDLVTTAWWDDIWLNEGFANWMERKISARFEPAWHEELAELQERNGALTSDSLVSARQIRQPIRTPDDILNAFDGITYNKGASVLNMFERWIGPDVFMKGVRAYLARHAFGNATSTDFARAIGEAAGVDVSGSLATFLEQPGAPELDVAIACQGAPRVELAQHRYLPPGAAAPAPGKPWVLPVCVAYDQDGKRGEACGVLSQPTGAIALAAKRCPRWVMPNVDGRGYYRVAYQPAQVTALRDSWRQLKPTERLAMFYDVSSLTRAGKLPLPLAMSFLPPMLAAGDRASISSAVELASSLHIVMPEELRPRYAAWMRTTFGPAARKAGLTARPDDGLDVEVARAQLIEAAGGLGGDRALATEAERLAARWRDLPQAARGNVLRLAVNTSAPTFERLLAAAPTEPDRDRRTQLLFSLGSASNPERQRVALALLLDARLDIREAQGVLFGSSSEVNHDVAAQFFREHKEDIMKRMPMEGTANGIAYYAYLFTRTCNAAKRDGIAAYVTETFAKVDGGPRVVQQAVEAMDQCIAQRALLEPGIRAWLK